MEFAFIFNTNITTDKNDNKVNKTMHFYCDINDEIIIGFIKTEMKLFLITNKTKHNESLIRY